MLDRRLRILEKSVKTLFTMRAVRILIVISGNKYLWLSDPVEKLFRHRKFIGQTRACQISENKNKIGIEVFEKSRK